MAYYRNGSNNGYPSDPYGSSLAAVASNAQYSSGGSPAQPQSYDGYSPNEPGPFDLSSVQLPAPNAACYSPPGDLKGQVRYVKHDDQNETKTVEQNLNDVKEIYRENLIHHQHNKNVLINVNRTHNHLIKVVSRDHNMHHYLINNIVKINDIHHQRIEQVRGEGRTSTDYKQTQRFETGGCRRADDGGSSVAYAAAPAPAPQADSGSSIAAVAWQAPSPAASAVSYAQQAQGSCNGQYRQY